MAISTPGAAVAPEQLALQRLYHWEKTAPDRVILTQPLGGGAIRDFTWGQAMGEVRRMAAHLRSLGYPPGSRIAILSKNSAHWLLADFAIWMAGHVSVPLYPTLAARRRARPGAAAPISAMHPPPGGRCSPSLGDPPGMH